MTAASTAPGTGSAPEYHLHSDLAKLCLPQTFQDAHKKLAWINSICLLFLIVGLVGLKQQRIIQKPLSSPTEVVPVIFTPPEETPPDQPPPKPDETEPPPPDQISDQPAVVTLVAPNPAAVAFPVVVKGPVAIAPTHNLISAPPPPSKQQVAPPKPSLFNSRAASGGRYPDPSYPRVELLARHEGKVMLYVIVGSNGEPTSVTVRDSSGWPTLDRHAAKWVEENWRWVPGETRHYLVPVIFQIR